MRILLGTTPTPIRGTRHRPLIQNLGPGNVYVDTDGDVDADSGFKIVPNSVYEFPTAGAGSKGIFLVADAANTDVRIVSV